MKLLAFAAGVLALAAIPVGAQSINGAGATFPYPIYSKWFSEYNRIHPEIKINYQSIGSGGGIRQVSDGIVDFGATDSPMTDQQIAAAKVKTVHIPTVLGAVVPVYNLPGLGKDLNFSGDVIADIYLGKIKKWNDPRIAKDNPGINFPDQPILPIYRSDGSGTTYILTDFLAKVSPEWSTRVGRNTSVRWFAGIGQKGNEGVAGLVRQAPYAFGYVELVFAAHNKMAFGAVKNPSGAFVKASIESVTAAATATAKTLPADFRGSITNASGPASYPISSFTWLLLPTVSRDPAKAKALSGFLLWMLDHGEGEAAAQYYAPLPKQVQDAVRKVAGQIR
ncbi:MAG: phosphate ABC transporter substrate-binding protein PstS [Acidobacteria bacterium]|nr:phosphate ABC transporter substrate-binding protein PstS [Acidobacteriota bacterium]